MSFSKCLLLITHCLVTFVYLIQVKFIVTCSKDHAKISRKQVFKKTLKLTFLQLKAVCRNSVYQYYLHMLLTLLPSFFSPTASWTFFCSAGSVSVDEEEKEEQSNRQTTFFITQRFIHGVEGGPFSYILSHIFMHAHTYVSRNSAFSILIFQILFSH